MILVYLGNQIDIESCSRPGVIGILNGLYSNHVFIFGVSFELKGVKNNTFCKSSRRIRGFRETHQTKMSVNPCDGQAQQIIQVGERKTVFLPFTTG